MDAPATFRVGDWVRRWYLGSGVSVIGRVESVDPKDSRQTYEVAYLIDGEIDTGNWPDVTHLEPHTPTEEEVFQWMLRELAR
jgi:hypothetical protein